MRCVAKIAEVVYPKLENWPRVPLTPRRRAHSISEPRGCPSPPPGNEDGDNAEETESDDGEIDEHWSSHKEISQDDSCEEKAETAGEPQQQSGDSSSHCDSSETRNPESKSKPGDSTPGECEKYSCAMTKMLFEILQNLLADILNILEKVTLKTRDHSTHLFITYLYVLADTLLNRFMMQEPTSFLFCIVYDIRCENVVFVSA